LDLTVAQRIGSDLNNNLLKCITLLLTPLALLETLASYSTNISHSLTKSLHRQVAKTDKKSELMLIKRATALLEFYLQ